jgi:catalase
VYPLPRDALESMYDSLGRTAGVRPGHAKGIFCAGVFTPTAAAGELTRAPHMQDRPVEVTVRFSNVTGDPNRSDANRGFRGMATKFHLDGGACTDLIAITMPCFTNRTPQDFIYMNGCFKYKSGKTKMKPLAMLFFMLRHRESWRGVLARYRVKRFPSYANYRYNSLNAFKWIDAHGNQHYVRYSWVPVETGAPIGRTEAKSLEQDYLQQDLYERLGRAPTQPVLFQLEVQLASQKDLDRGRISDATARWPDKHHRIVTALAGDRRPRFIVVGRLELTSLQEKTPGNPADLRFDPTAVTDGIEPSDDTILRFRHPVYELAFRERTGSGLDFPSDQA